LAVAREMIAEGGVGSVTMDALAERAGLGKGTVFRRFGTRAGIFKALLEEEAHRFQEQVLNGPPPLGPGARAEARLTAYGRARIDFLIDNLDVARAATDRGFVAGPPAAVDMTLTHFRVLLREAGLGLRDPEILAVQLAAALEGPLLGYQAQGAGLPAPEAGQRLADGWRDLVERLFRGEPN
jgi:AcrR family transcriptional regulator